MGCLNVREIFIKPFKKNSRIGWKKISFTHNDIAIHTVSATRLLVCKTAMLMLTLVANSNWTNYPQMHIAVHKRPELCYLNVHLLKCVYVTYYSSGRVYKDKCTLRHTVAVASLHTVADCALWDFWELFKTGQISGYFVVTEETTSSFRTFRNPNIQ